MYVYHQRRDLNKYSSTSDINTMIYIILEKCFHVQYAHSLMIVVCVWHPTIPAEVSNALLDCDLLRHL